MDINIRNNGKSTALIWACDMGHTEVAKVLILHGAEASGYLLDDPTYQKGKVQAEAEGDAFNLNPLASSL